MRNSSATDRSGPTMIYLDNAATSFPKPETVYRVLDEFARNSLANPGRSGHRMALESERVLDDARHALNQFFKGDGPDRWIFTLNCTDALNMAIKGTLDPGDHVITSDLEHNSISRPLRAMEKAGTITLTRVTSEAGYIDPETIRDALTPKTRLVAITHAANVLGTVQPIGEIAAIVREANVLFYLVEAVNLVQTVNRPNLRLNVDYYHLYKQNEPPEHFTAAIPYLAHAHTSDDQRGFPGLGDWDQRPFLRSLKAAGYDSRLSFEVRDNGTARFAEAARMSVRLMRDLHAEVARS